MTDIERLMQDTLCSKKRAESVLRASASYEAAVRNIRYLQKLDAENMDSE